MSAKHFTKSCGVPDCARPYEMHGYCHMHAARWKRYGNALYRKKAGNGEVKGKPCCIPECLRGGRATFNDLIYCNVHIYRMRTHGNPYTVKKLGNGQSTIERQKQQAAERQRRYLATPHGKMRSRFNRGKKRAIQFGADWTTGITKETLLALYAQTHCGICKKRFKLRDDRTIDHIVALSRGGANHPDNLQMAHGPCNYRKNYGRA